MNFEPSYVPMSLDEQVHYFEGKVDGLPIDSPAYDFLHEMYSKLISISRMGMEDIGLRFRALNIPESLMLEFGSDDLSNAVDYLGFIDDLRVFMDDVVSLEGNQSMIPTLAEEMRAKVVELAPRTNKEDINASLSRVRLALRESEEQIQSVTYQACVRLFYSFAELIDGNQHRSEVSEKCRWLLDYFDETLTPLFAYDNHDGILLDYLEPLREHILQTCILMEAKKRRG